MRSQPRKDDSPSESGLMTKWAVNKAPDHDAKRVRNNQRRHRERVRNHIGNLEGKVKELEGRLSAAYDQINDLTEQLEDMRSQKAGTIEQLRPHRHCQPIVPFHCSTDNLSLVTEATSNEGRSQNQMLFDSALSVSQNIIIDTSERCCRPRAAGCARDAITDCTDLPAPRPNESTTSCEEAFRILEQQSTCGLDLHKTEEYLRPGYRRALQGGDGCRVQTHLVYGLLDQLTST
jgi:hypothetical protein